MRPIDFLSKSKKFKLKNNPNLPFNFLPTVFGTWINSKGKVFNNKGKELDTSTLTNAGLSYNPNLFENRIDQALFEGWILVSFDQGFGGFKLNPHKKINRKLKFTLSKDLEVNTDTKKKLIAIASFYSEIFLGRFEYEIEYVSFPVIEGEDVLLANYRRPIKIYSIRVFSMYI